MTMTEGKENHVLLHVIPVKVSTKDENSITTYHHLADIIMPEVELKQVSIIIGEDVKRVHIVQQVRVSEFPKDELHATRTALGWTIAGSIMVNGASKRKLSVNFLDTNDQTLNRQLQRFGEMEAFGLKEADLAKTASVEDH